MFFKRVIAPLAATAVIAIPVSVSAQTAAWRLPSLTHAARSADDGQAAYYETRRAAYDQGYRQGVREGEKDARAGDRFAYQDERDYQRADRGYHRRYGDRGRYRQLFREGYAAGYSEAYRRFSRYGRNPGSYGPGVYRPQGPYAQRGGYGSYPRAYYSPAFDNGVRDGLEKGREDARKNRSYDPVRHSWYRSGDRHYEREYGTRDEYKNIYRRGFQQGYEQGYQGRYRW